MKKVPKTVKATALRAARRDSAYRCRWGRVQLMTVYSCQQNPAILCMIKQQYLPSHARHFICLLLLMAASTEELQHSESICSLDGLGVKWRDGYWVERARSASAVTPGNRRKPKSILFENLNLNIERPKRWSSGNNRWEIFWGESVDTHSCPEIYRDLTKHTTVKLDWLITTPDFTVPQIQVI